MNGVVLFADDQIHKGGAESKLYEQFRKDFVVLTVDNLSHLHDALQAVSTFDVIILDWEFDEQDPELAGLESRNPMSTIEELRPFSKIFIYSSGLIADGYRKRLEELFPDRVFFAEKNLRRDQTDKIEDEYKRIKAEIEDFANKNQNVKFSVEWSKAINRALQSIFGELYVAHNSWLKFLYETSLDDNLDAILEVVQLMNNLLAEKLVQNNELQKVIKAEANSAITPANPDEKAARLFQRIYYTAIADRETPIMTGDIFDMPDGSYAILITPECDVYFREKEKKVFKEYFEVLLMNKSDILAEFKKPDPKSEDQKKKFNQSSQTRHILPSFPYEDEKRLLPGVITFSTAIRSILSADLQNTKRRYKLNAPYVQQLRQRFAASHSRVGVPAINDLVKSFNLEQAKLFSTPPKVEQQVTGIESPLSNQTSENHPPTAPGCPGR